MSPAPAAFARRYVAWSLDLGMLATVVGLACAPRLRDGLGLLAERYDAACMALAEAAIDVLVHGTHPLASARAWLHDPPRQGAIAALSDALAATFSPPLHLLLALALVWWVGWEASPWQATPGKRLLGLRVAAAGGTRIGLARALGRHLAGTLSWATLNLGHLLALAPPAHAALHDRIAGTRVLQAPAQARLPGWAWAWLALQAGAATVATAWLAVATQDALQRAFDALP